MRLPYGIITFLLFLSTGLKAQVPAYDIQIFGFEAGISHRNVTRVRQGPEGYLWAGTIRGFNRFDGERFIHLHENSRGEALPVEKIRDFYIDDDGGIYLLSPEQLIYYEPHRDSVRFFQFKKRKSHEVSVRRFDQLIVNDGRIWVMATEEPTGRTQLWMGNHTDSIQRATTWDNLNARPVLHTWHSGIILTAGAYLYFYKNENTVPQKHPMPWGEGQFVKAIFQRKDALFLLLNTGDIYKIEMGDFSSPVLYFDGSRLPDKQNLSGLHIDHQGNLWISGLGVLWHFQPPNGLLTNLHPAIMELVKYTVQIRQVMQDRQGVFWLATNFGLIKMTHPEKQFAHYLNEGNDHCASGYCSMRGITGDGDGRIFFSYYNGIHVLNTRRNDLRPLMGDNRFFNAPFGLQYYEGALFTGNGLRIEVNSRQVLSVLDVPRTDVGVLTVSHDSTLWLGYEGDLYWFDTNRKKFQRYENTAFQAIQKRISCIIPGEKNRTLWVGTDDAGLIHLHLENGIIRQYKNEGQGSLPANRILNMKMNTAGNLWLGTANGLSRLNTENETFKTYTEREGMPNNFVNGILLEGDSAVWASTDNGLARLSILTEDIANYFERDGISANEFNRLSCYKSVSGSMYFGGLNGVNAFLPEQVTNFRRRPQEAAPLLLTGFSRYDGTGDSVVQRHFFNKNSLHIRLSPNDKFFTFEFALADYRQPHSIRYTYILEGFEKDWSATTTDNFARYNNIPPGSYTFRVKAVRGSQSHQPPVLTIPIFIEKAFYKKWWFIALCAALLTAVVYGYMRWREINIRKRAVQLKREVRLRTMELQEEKRKSEDLLLNILPAETANELKLHGKSIARRHEEVTVLFTDFEDFSKIAEEMEPEMLVGEIDHCFRAFDYIIEKYHLEKIKTIGDAYMCAAGINNDERRDPAIRIVKAGLEIQEFMEAYWTQKQNANALCFKARIGVHTGPIVAGIVGVKKFAYDIWGDTVNIAARMEANGKTGRVNISEATYHRVKEYFECTAHNKFITKNKGEIQMFWVARNSNSHT